MKRLPINIPMDRIAEVCRRRRIKELRLFGSVLREDFRSDSDVDVLVTFTDNAEWGLFDLVHMEEEPAAIVGRRVDLVDRQSVDAGPNYIRRRHILRSTEPLCVAG